MSDIATIFERTARDLHEQWAASIEDACRRAVLSGVTQTGKLAVTCGGEEALTYYFVVEMPGLRLCHAMRLDDLPPAMRAMFDKNE